MFSVRYELTLVFKGSNSLLAASPAAVLAAEPDTCVLEEEFSLAVDVS